MSVSAYSVKKATKPLVSQTTLFLNSKTSEDLCSGMDVSLEWVSSTIPNSTFIRVVSLLLVSSTTIFRMVSQVSNSMTIFTTLFTKWL